MSQENVQVFIGPPPYQLVAINPEYLFALLNLLQLPNSTMKIVKAKVPLDVIARIDYEERG